MLQDFFYNLRYMDRRKQVMLIIIAVLILALIALWLYIWLRPKQPVQPPQGQTATSTEINVEPVAPIAPASEERQKMEAQYPLALKQVAMSFAERFNSYSTDEPKKNLSDLLPLMTLKLQQETNDGLAARNDALAPAFVGYSAKALSSELNSITATDAVAKVNLQIMKYAGKSSEPEISYLEMDLKFKKIGADWRVDSYELR